MTKNIMVETKKGFTRKMLPGEGKTYIFINSNLLSYKN